MYLLYAVCVCVFNDAVVDVIVTLEKVLFDILDQKISESQFLVPDNYGILNSRTFHTLLHNAY